MKTVFGHIILIALLILLALSIGLSYHRALRKWSSVSHPQAVVRLYPENKHYVTEDDIRRIIAGTPRNGVQDIPSLVHRLESELERHPMVENAEVWLGPDGLLHAEIRQITPIAVVRGNGSVSYIDRRGKVLPVSRLQKEPLPVLTGIIGRAEVKKLFPLLTYIHRQARLHGQVRRMEYDGNNLRLYLRTLSSPVVFGDTDDYRWKFYKLLEIEKYLTGRKAANPYTEINLMFDNQIVCTKNN